MNLITQNGELVIVKGDVEMCSNKIKFNGISLGEYDEKRVCEVYAELACHSWNHKKDDFKMPIK